MIVWRYDYFAHQNDIYPFFKYNKYMLFWGHDYFTRQNYTYLFWVDVILVACFFCLPKWHLLILKVDQVDVLLPGKDIAGVFWCWHWSLHWKCNLMSSYVKKYWNSEFSNWNSDLMTFQQQNSKINPTRIPWICNGIGIQLLMGISEIGTENLNSQPRPYGIGNNQEYPQSVNLNKVLLHLKHLKLIAIVFRPTLLPSTHLVI